MNLTDDFDKIILSGTFIVLLTAFFKLKVNINESVWEKKYQVYMELTSKLQASYSYITALNILVRRYCYEDNKLELKKNQKKITAKLDKEGIFKIISDKSSEINFAWGMGRLIINSEAHSCISQISELLNFLTIWSVDDCHWQKQSFHLEQNFLILYYQFINHARNDLKSGKMSFKNLKVSSTNTVIFPLAFHKKKVRRFFYKITNR